MWRSDTVSQCTVTQWYRPYSSDTVAQCTVTQWYRPYHHVPVTLTGWEGQAADPHINSRNTLHSSCHTVLVDEGSIQRPTSSSLHLVVSTICSTVYGWIIMYGKIGTWPTGQHWSEISFCLVRCIKAVMGIYWYAWPYIPINLFDL